MVRHISLLFLLALSLRLDAAVHVWSGAVSDRFSDAGNWTGGSPAGDGAAELSFPGGVSRTALNNDLSNLTVRSISFASAGYTLRGLPVTLAAGAQIQTSSPAGNELALDLILAGEAYVLHVSSGELTFSGTISGSGPLTKRGPGTSIFSGTRANTYSGATRVLEGNLRLAKPDYVPAVPAALFIGATGVNYENGSVSVITREQIPDDATVHVGPFCDLHVGSVETIGGLVLEDTASVMTGVPVGNWTLTSGRLIVAGDISVLNSSSNDVSLYGNIAIAGIRKLNMCFECNIRINALSEASPGSGLVIQGSGSDIAGYDSVDITGTYRGPTIVDGVRALINNPNTAVRHVSGRFSGSVSSLVTEGGRLRLAGGVVTKGDMRLSPTTVVVGGVSRSLPLFTAGGILDLGRAKFEYEWDSNFDRVLGNAYVLGSKQSTGPILGNFSGLAEGDVIDKTWRVSYQGGDGNDFTLTDVGRFPTALRFEARPDSVQQGEKVTLTVTLGIWPVPTGQTGAVTFSGGGTVIGTVPVVNGSASLETPAPSYGNHVYRAEFTGSAQYSPATAAATIRVLPPTPVLTSIEPSTVPGGEPVVLTVRGTNLLPGGRIVVNSGVYDPVHVSNEEVRLSFTADRYEEKQTALVEYWQPSPGVVRSNQLPLTVLASPAEKTRLTFEPRAITGPVVPGGGAAWMSIASAVRSGRPVTEHRIGITPDSNTDGIARWEQTEDVPTRGLWLMVDMRDGTILSGEPMLRTAPRPASFPQAMFLRDPGGAYAYVLLPSHILGDVMLVRPGVGAWYSLGVDGGGRDLDGAPNGLWVFQVASMQPVADSPPAPDGVQPGDVFLSIESAQRWTGDKVDNHLRESDGPGTVRFVGAYTQLSTNEKDGVANVNLLRTGGTDGAVSVDFSTANGTAIAGVNYVATAGRVTFGPGEILKTIVIPLLNDTVYGGDTRFSLVLSNPAGTTITGGDSRTIAVIEDDPAPKLSASDVTVNEGDEGTREIAWTVTISGVTRLPVTANVSQREEPYGNGFVFEAIAFYPGGPTAQTVRIKYSANRIPQENRVYGLSLSSVMNASSEGVRGRITIVDDDFAELDVVDATLVEGKTGTVTVSISDGSWKPVRVKYTLVGGSAAAGTDFTAATGTLEFDRTHSRRTIPVPVTADGVAEGVETLTVVLSDPINARIRRGTATLTIVDATTPVITAVPFVAREGADAAFVFRLSEPMSTPVSFRVTTNPGTATAPSDFPAKTSELVTFQSADTPAYFPIKLPNDNEVEGTESFTLTLSDASGATIATPVVTATILDGNAPPLNPALAAATITDAVVTEGNAGTAPARFTLSLGGAALTPVAVAWSTADATAVAGSDYTGAAGTLTFQPGETSKTIDVLVHGDKRHEIDETFTVVIGNGRIGTARIVNDDAAMPRHRPSGH